jgi:hypothetical protein
MSIVITELQQKNSTTYVDLLGVLLGLSRLPGETSQQFYDRLMRASKSNRTHQYVGLINELTLQLGLSLYAAVSLSGPVETNVSVSIAGIQLSNASLAATTIPLFTTDIDDLWSWRMLSAVVADINAAGYTATMLIEDTPAIVLLKQQNTLLVLAQSISGQDINLGYTGVEVGTELFNIAVPSYTLTADGQLHFSSPVADGTQITFQWQAWPYNIVASDVNVLSLTDPDLATVAVAPDGNLVYQIREYIQNIVGRDLSYWGT